MVLPNNALCELDVVRDSIGLVTADTEHDDMIEILIGGVSQVIEQHCGHALRYSGAATTEYIDIIQSGQGDLWVTHWPTQSITSIYEDTGRDYAASSLLVAGDDYVDRSSDLRKKGLIRRLDAVWAMGVESVKVTYENGYALVTDVPVDLAKACELLTVWYFNKTAQGNGILGLQSESKGDGSLTYSHPDEWPPLVVKMLRPYRDKRW